MRSTTTVLPSAVEIACPGVACEAAGETTALALVVEDDERVRDLYVRLLGSAGYRCVVAKDAGEAATALAYCRPDLGVFDVTMLGADCADLARYARIKRPGLRLVAVTKRRRLWDTNDLVDLGFDGIFTDSPDTVRFLRLCATIRQRP